MSAAQPALSTRPGSVLAWLIYRETGAAGCGCDARRKAMDRWGWRGCFKRRRRIVRWVVLEARKRGHDVQAGEVLGLMRAAFLEVQAQQRGLDPH